MCVMMRAKTRAEKPRTVYPTLTIGGEYIRREKKDSVPNVDDRLI